MRKHYFKPLMLVGAAALAATVLAGCVVVPARPVYGAAPSSYSTDQPVYTAPAQIYIVPPPIFFGPRFWFGGHWVYRRH
jgi:hypothetical protein